MSRWWRAEDTSIDHPKLLGLSDALHRAWYTLMCVASANGGELPPSADIALRLRMKPAKVAEWITKLVAAGLFDRGEDGVFRPHNWNKRQYKTDGIDRTNAQRQQRYRDKRNGKSNGEGNAVTTVMTRRPETEQITDTEQKQNSEAIASGAEAPRDWRAELFGRGRETLARLTGKGPDSCRSFIGKCLKAANDDAMIVLGLIEDAERNRVADPSAWIAARLKGTTGPPGRPLTPYQQQRADMKEILDGLENFSRRGGNSGQADPRLLPGDSGERPEGLRGGPGANVIDLPAGGGRASG